MLTSSIITLVKKEYPDWSRAIILTFLDEIQRIIFTQNTTRHMMMYDSSTGKDPVLTTTAGTYEYEINTTNGFDNNAWRVTAVYTDDIDDPVNVETFDYSGSTYARILFRSDPGTTTYYIKAYRLPTQLLAEPNSLEIPAQYHLSHVFEGVCGMIEKYRSGVSERWNTFEKILMPDLIKRMSDSNSGIYSVSYKGY